VSPLRRSTAINELNLQELKRGGVRRFTPNADTDCPTESPTPEATPKDRVGGNETKTKAKATVTSPKISSRDD
jgi:hypothetical protein